MNANLRMFLVLLILTTILFISLYAKNEIINSNYKLIVKNNEICKVPDLSYAYGIALKHMTNTISECDLMNGTNFVEIVDALQTGTFVLRLNVKDLAYRVNMSEIVCKVERFDKIFNTTEYESTSTLNTTELNKQNNYTVYLTQHGYYDVMCFRKILNGTLVRVYDDKFILLPRNMSKLIEERQSFKPFTKKTESVRLLEEDNSFKLQKKMNVLMIRIDSLSHQHFPRGFPETFDYLSNKLENNQFFTSATSVGENTHPNMLPQFSGVVIESIESLNLSSEWGSYKKLDDGFYDPYPFIWYEYENEGYLTGYQEDCPYIGPFNYVKQGFRFRPTAFYARPQWSRIYQSKEGDRSNKCIHGRPIYKTFFDNIESFLQRMHDVEENANTPYFLFNFMAEYTHTNFAHHEEVDKFFKQMLVKFERRGYFENTLLYIYSDHGQRLAPYTFFTESGRIEKNWPMLSIRLPRQLWGSKFDANFKKNVNKLLSFYDQYQTLRHFLHINANYSKEMDARQFTVNEKNTRYLRGISLFEKIPTNRKCSEAMIPDNYCPCLHSSQITENEFIKQTGLTFNDAIGYILSKIGSFTANATNVCFPFQIKKLDFVKQYNESLNRYQFDLTTMPGNAKFLTTLEITEKQFQLYGKIIRSSLYGNQSHCVKDSFLKNYCFCRDMLNKV